MNSSSGESTAPLDFHISSSCEDNSRFNIYTEDCPLCLKASRNFYCKTCIQHGEFFHSSGIKNEKFGDLRMRYLVLMKDKFLTEKACKEALAVKVNVANIKGNIEIVQEKVKILTLLLDEKLKRNSMLNQVNSKVKKINIGKYTRLQRYDDRVVKLKYYVNMRYSIINDAKQDVIIQQGILKKLRLLNIGELVTTIFPISAIEPPDQKEEDSTITALEEACHTAFVRGKWVSPNLSSERQHRIVAPSLPASGDYSAYNDWVAANKDSVLSTSSNTTVVFNPAYNISAALTFTTQLVNVLAYILDVMLPSKLCYSEFCGNELSISKFMKKVARLNWNVLHLCFSQNVEPRLLRPETTLNNILLLLDQTVSDLGRSLTPDINPEETRVLEDALRPLLEIEDPDDSWDDSLSYEWEAVPTSNGLPECEPIQNIQSHQVSSTSVAGGLLISTATSIASLLRWHR